jgi:hypothetical protein
MKMSSEDVSITVAFAALNAIDVSIMSHLFSLSLRNFFLEER